MKKRSIFMSGICLLFCVVLPKSALAHMPGQPPYLLMNGKYADFYPVQAVSISDFPLPQDAAPATYLLNTPIHFAFDTNRIPVPPDVIKKTVFAWDFGDGEKGSGLSLDHTYTKVGSYFVQITVDDGQTPTPQLLESVMVHVLPYSSYKMPHAVLLVNGNQSRSFLKDPLSTDFTTAIHFDGSVSEAKGSSIQAYYWDFGDEKTSTTPTLTHQYNASEKSLYVMLRITDAKGIISDTAVQLYNAQFPNPGRKITQQAVTNASAKSQQNKGLPSVIILGGIGLVVLVLGVLFFLKR